jgi:YidC/Oxa1 family membrane protein insertase
MKFYQENKINPLAGCLPLVVQLPIFFALFRVLRDPYKHIPKKGSFAGLYQAFCDHAISTHKACSPSTLTHLKFLTIDLQKTATDAHGSVWAAIPFFILVALAVVTGYLQTKQAQSRTPQTNKQMGTIMKILPVFFGLISLSFPAGLVLYFFISNTWRVGQQEVIFRRIGSAAGPAPGKLGSGKSTEPIDVASADHPDNDSDSAAELPAAEAPPEEPRRPAPRRPAPSEPRPARAPVPQRERSGGLRGFFQLPPPPPEGNGGGRPPGTTRPSPAGSGARSSGAKPGGAAARRPPPQRRRSSKKKRKR